MCWLLTMITILLNKQTCKRSNSTSSVISCLEIFLSLPVFPQDEGRVPTSYWNSIMVSSPGSHPELVYISVLTSQVGSFL